MVCEPTRAALLNLATGAGKTAISLWVSKELKAQTILIVAPLNTEDGWERHIGLIRPDLPLHVIDSKNLDKFTLLQKGEPGIYFVTRTYFGLSGTSLAPRRKPDGTYTRGRVQLLDWRKAKPDLMISDESQEANNRETTAYKVLKHPKPGFKLALSATPAGNKFDRLWEVTRWLWPDHIDRSKNRWAAEWCAFERNRFKFSGMEIVGEKHPGAFVASLPCYVTDTGDRDTGKVPVTTIKVSCPLTGVQQQQYRAMRDTAIAWLDDNPLVASLPIVQKTRLRQIALGEVSFNDKGEVDFADDCMSTKLDACQQILDKHPGEPVIFYTDSRKFAQVAAKRLGGRTWTGTISKKSRLALKADFLAGKFTVLVAVISAFGTGTDGLQNVCHTEVWLNKSFNDMRNDQCEGRLNRTGQRYTVSRYILVAPNSGDTEDLDKLVLKRTRLKASL